MSEALERAAKALLDAARDSIVRLPINNPHVWGTPMDQLGVDVKDAARAAVLAFLDPADEEIVRVALGPLRSILNEDHVRGLLLRLAALAEQETP